MALCTSCGNQVEESASFCTSCGTPMPASAHLSAAVTVARPVCSSCGAQADPGSVFCTECGKPLNAQAEPVAEAVTASPAIAATVPLSVEATPAVNPPTAFCTNCGSKLESGTGFCTNCGQPVAGSSAPSIATESTPTEVSAAPHSEVEPTSSDETVTALPANAGLPNTSVAVEPTVIVAAAAPTPKETTRATATTPLVKDQPGVTDSVKPTPVVPAPQVAAPLYATPGDSAPAQPGGGAFRIIVLILLLLILVGGLGGWYFMGVETVIVCSPPDVTVFLDDKELAPASYGRYVVPHLSRQPHLLRVQRPGFSDTIERLDFPLTSLHEWVNIKLVPRRTTRPSRPR